MIRRLLLGISAGLLAGSGLGLLEALWVLTTAGAPSEYVALFYGVVLYGVIGLVAGLGSGLAVALLGLVHTRLKDPGAWTLGFMGVFLLLGSVITVDVVDRVVYQEQGISATGGVVLACVGLVAALVGLWILPILMTRTPLKILMHPKGTATLWMALVVLAAVFSFAPGGPDPDGTMRPDRGQDPRLRTRPNVLVVLVDSLRADEVGCYGEPGSDRTPSLDELAAEGVVFEQAFAAATWTRASTASLFTSMLPGSHRTQSESSVLPSEFFTVAEVLQEQGWVTGGLPNHIDLTRSFNFQQGFDYFHYLAPNYLLGATESASHLSMYEVIRSLRAKWMPVGLQVTDFYQPSEVALDHAREFISAQGPERWFLFVHLMEPHEPYFRRPLDGTGYAFADHEQPAVEDANALHETYRNEVAAMDRELGQFFAWLRPEHWDDTLIVVTSDHGEEFRDHGGWGHGSTLYDEALHVPLIVKLPGPHRNAGLRVPWQVRTLDLPPTLAGLLGFPPSPQWQGENLFDRSFEDGQARLRSEAEQTAAVTRGEPGAEPPPVLEPGVHPEDRQVVAQINHDGNVLSAIRAGGWKYIKALPDGPRGLEPEELFHVGVDPRERANLAGGAGLVQARLDQQLAEALSLAESWGISGEVDAEDGASTERMRALGYSQ